MNDSFIVFESASSANRPNRWRGIDKSRPFVFFDSACWDHHGRCVADNAPAELVVGWE